MENNYIDIYYNEIMQTEVNLYDLITKDAFERGLAFLADLLGDENAKENCIKIHVKRIEIFDKLIEETGCIVSLSKMDLSSIANPKNYEVIPALTTILLEASKEFINNKKNKNIVSKIKTDKAYVDEKNKGKFDNLESYITYYICKKEGIYN